MKQVEIDDWAFALFPEIGKKGRIVALLGYLPDGKFLPGSGRIVACDTVNKTATSESGTVYLLGEADGTNPETLKLAVAKYSTGNKCI
jgi:hypothetical protein